MKPASARPSIRSGSCRVFRIIKKSQKCDTSLTSGTESKAVRSPHRIGSMLRFRKWVIEVHGGSCSMNPITSKLSWIDILLMSYCDTWWILLYTFTWKESCQKSAALFNFSGASEQYAAKHPESGTTFFITCWKHWTSSYFNYSHNVISGRSSYFFAFLAAGSRHFWYQVKRKPAHKNGQASPDGFLHQAIEVTI